MREKERGLGRLSKCGIAGLVILIIFMLLNSMYTRSKRAILLPVVHHSSMLHANTVGSENASLVRSVGRRFDTGHGYVFYNKQGKLQLQFLQFFPILDNIFSYFFL